MPPEPTRRRPTPGYLFFECANCHFSAKWPSRDWLTPSGLNCPECLEWLTPNGGEAHPEWPVDRSGNLIRQEMP